MQVVLFRNTDTVQTYQLHVRAEASRANASPILLKALPYPFPVPYLLKF